MPRHSSSRGEGSGSARPVGIRPPSPEGRSCMAPAHRSRCGSGPRTSSQTHTPGLSALQLQRQLGIARYETAWAILHKLRRAMVRPDRAPLKDHVEVDEPYIGGPEVGWLGGRQLLDKVLVVGA